MLLYSDLLETWPPHSRLFKLSLFAIAVILCHVVTYSDRKYNRSIGKGPLLWQVGLIVNVKLHFWQIATTQEPLEGGGCSQPLKKVWPWKVTINRSNGGHTKLKKKYLKTNWGLFWAFHTSSLPIPVPQSSVYVSILMKSSSKFFFCLLATIFGNKWTKLVAVWQ